MVPLAKAVSYNNTLYFQTLKGHTIDSLKILKAYIETNYDVIDQFCSRWGLNKESFLKSLFITIYFHDIGKLTKQFQENIRSGRSSQKYPHALYSQFILNEIDFPSLLDVSVEKTAILGHHTQLHSQLYAEYEGLNKPSFLEKNIGVFVKDSKTIYSELEFYKWFSFNGLNINSLPETRKFWGILGDYRNELIIEASLFEDKEKLKSIFCYIFSILKICDDYSSAEFSDFIHKYNGNTHEFDSVIKDPSKYVLRLCIKNPYEIVLKKNTPYEYQRDEPNKLCGDVPFYCMLFAPCGRGKTETALIWALKAMKKYNRNKIIFAMPTQVTSNAMWERFCEIFGQGKTREERIESGKKYVGLFHGKSFIKLKSEKERQKEEKEDLTTEDLEEIKGENFKGNIFFKPITVTTIDHLIYSFVHGFSQADFALGNLQNAVVVFDEVHYYEKHTLEHIITLLELLKKMRIPHLLMSGTLPEFFIRTVKEINSEYSGPYKDNEGLSFEPFKIVLSEKRFVKKERINKKIIEEIVKNYNKGLIQFIILNTIERSKIIYETLIKQLPQCKKQNRIMLYHSQFTFKDREKKERNIIEVLKKGIRPFILVATQVIEVSLDISCDVMYTELAPGDALGQRGGRLNRKGHLWVSNGLEHCMKVFLPEEIDGDSPKKRPYDIEILKKTMRIIKNGPYSYLKLKNLCDNIYKDYKLNIPTNLKDTFRKCSIFGHSPHNINFGNEEEGRMIQLRIEEIPHFDVIPWDYYAGEENNLTVENQVKIPIWWYKIDEKKHGTAKYFTKIPKKIGKGGKYYWVTTIPYSEEKGFDFKVSFGYSEVDNFPSRII